MKTVMIGLLTFLVLSYVQLAFGGWEPTPGKWALYYTGKSDTGKQAEQVEVKVFSDFDKCNEAMVNSNEAMLVTRQGRFDCFWAEQSFEKQQDMAIHGGMMLPGSK